MGGWGKSQGDALYITFETIDGGVSVVNFMSYTKSTNMKIPQNVCAVCEVKETGRILFKDALHLREFQENSRKRRAPVGLFRSARRTQKNVGQIGLLGNLYDALFSRFRAPIGSLKKTATYKIEVSSDQKLRGGG